MLIPYTKGGLRGLQVGFSDLAVGVGMKTSTALEQLRKGLLPEGLFKSDSAAKITPPSQPAPSAATESGSNVLKNWTGWFQSQHSLHTSTANAKESKTLDIDPKSTPATSSTNAAGVRIDTGKEEDSRKQPPVAVTPSDILQGLNGRHGRFDFAIQGGVLETKYLSMMTSHFWYWDDSCTAFFILKEIHGQ